MARFFPKAQAADFYNNQALEPSNGSADSATAPSLNDGVADASGGYATTAITTKLPEMGHAVSTTEKTLVVSDSENIDWLLSQVRLEELPLVKILRKKGLKDSHILMSLKRQRQTGEGLLEIMRPADYGFLSMEGIAQVMAQMSELEYIDGFEALRRLDEASLNEAGAMLDGGQPRNFMPLFYKNGVLQVALCDPKARSEARGMFVRLNCEFVIASEGVISTLFRRVFGRTQEAFEVSYRAYVKSIDAKDDAKGGELKDDLLMAILRHACFSGASDIRMQPMASGKGGQIFLRIDGVFRDFAYVRWDVYSALLSTVIEESGKAKTLNTQPIETRIKFEADANLRRRSKNSDIAQRYSFRGENIKTMPDESDFGYTTMVIRVLDNQSEEVDIHRLGIDEKTLKKLASYMARRGTTLLTTGAVGSGKSTLQTAAIRAFVDPVARSVQTIENPREFAMGLWMQYQQPRDSNEGEGATNISTGMLRNAVDLAVLGETRTEASAKLLIQMSNMAVFCMSTLHNNSAPSAITRLTDLGITRAQIAESICGVLGLALLRVLCAHCKIKDERSETIEVLNESPWVEKKTPFMVGAGCPHCQMTGYRGRKLTYELLDVDPVVSLMIHKGDAIADIGKKAIAPQDSMRGHAPTLVGLGEVDIDQVFSL